MIRLIAIKDLAQTFYSYPARVLLVGLFVSAALGVSACSTSPEQPVAGPNTARPTPPAAQTGPSVDASKVVPVAATASASTAGDQPKLAFDGDLKTVWNAGTVAPSWIQLDLGQPTTISKVLLNVSQSPPGPTIHNVSGGPTPDALTLIGVADGKTTDGQWVEITKPATNVRYLKIETIKSPSWISWREIEVRR